MLQKRRELLFENFYAIVLYIDDFEKKILRRKIRYFYWINEAFLYFSTYILHISVWSIANMS